ncbi:elicitor-responsive protein 3 [Nicotiana sylvestris]|uniref:Elicitor-responsive protein 3-like n=2 Tax=Nicotiana TaxID=4085 RepID=A0A1S4B0X4_TOBAC|nr:PREDICTED: elicitor-responsive protein 3 [Nicotiana sylvestris]XP_016482494.1 PREDICTED: elicitor-responsive protein 3-like [Nicotiana tabacum]
MKGGLLEVFVVSARGIRHSNIIGNPSYYVIVECGSQSYRTKTSSGNPKEILWNEKFKYELPTSKLEKWYYLKLKIMDEEFFTAGGFVGETTIYLKGIVTEGNEKGFMEVTPVAYNVVLEDDTYKGHIKVGLKFTPSNKTVQTVERENASKENVNNGVGQFIYSNIINLWGNTWWRSFIPYGDANSSIDKNKPN